MSWTPQLISPFGFVNHSFASVDKGQIGAIDVGDAHGTMTH